MSVYIPGMKVPKDCPMCPMAHWNGYGEFTGCEIVAGKKYADKTDPEYMKSASRPDWCPLVHVPEHGRLIDADALIAWFIEWYNLHADIEVCHVIAIIADPDCSPTIIPAEKEASDV